MTRPADAARAVLRVAPMMDWTDRHCRFFLRAISPWPRLYSEMVTTGALLFGDAHRHLEFDPAEHPVALQLGGSDPADLARCARLAADRGYDEVNLNIGCPSVRVQRGSFGACLMAEPALVADCVRAMRDAGPLPVTVKHRLGLDRVESYDFVRDFVGTVAAAGCEVFIAHARNAVLKGLSPKQNREVPRLRYDEVRRLKRDFPQLTIVLNGGLGDWPAILREHEGVDGVMIGRAAYWTPWLLVETGMRLHGEPAPAPALARADVAHVMHAYARREAARGVPLRAITRHMLNLYHATPGAKRWRRALSDSVRLATSGPDLILEALDGVESGTRLAA